MGQKQRLVRVEGVRLPAPVRRIPARACGFNDKLAARWVVIFHHPVVKVTTIERVCNAMPLLSPAYRSPRHPGAQLRGRQQFDHPVCPDAVRPEDCVRSSRQARGPGRHTSSSTPTLVGTGEPLWSKGAGQIALYSLPPADTDAVKGAICPSLPLSLPPRTHLPSLSPSLPFPPPHPLHLPPTLTPIPSSPPTPSPSSPSVRSEAA